MYRSAVLNKQVIFERQLKLELQKLLALHAARPQRAVSGGLPVRPFPVQPVRPRSKPVRIGFRPTKIPVGYGSPALDNCGPANYNCGQPPPSRLIPNGQRGDLSGYGDGFAFELAPLQASAPYSYGGDDFGCGCGCNGAPGGCGDGVVARPNSGELAVLGVGALAVVGLLAIPTFIVEPWIVKQFKPEWSYGKRLAAVMGFNIVSGSVLGLASRLAGGTPAPTTTTSTPATTP